jgi:hypothetical protein
MSYLPASAAVPVHNQGTISAEVAINIVHVWIEQLARSIDEIALVVIA